MWYDATSAVNTVESPESSTVVGKVGYAKAYRDQARLRLALHLVAGHPRVKRGQRRRLEVHLLDDRQAVHPDRRHPARLGTRPPGSRLSTYQIPQYRDISAAYGPITLVPSTRPLRPSDRSAGALHRSVPHHPRVPGPRHPDQPADQRRHRGQKSVDDALEQSQEYAEVVGKTYQSNMTTITPGSEQRAATQDAEHAARVRKAHDSAISRAEGWRRRGPLLPALIFMIVVSESRSFHPVLLTLSWNLVRPVSRQFVGLQNYVDVVGDSTFWQVTINTDRPHRRTVLISVVLGLLLALLLDRVFLGRGIVRTPADHAVPRHAGCRGADVEDRDARPGLRHRQLGPVAVRRRGRGLGEPIPAGLGDDQPGLAVDTVHDAADPRRPAVDATRHPGGRPSRRCGSGSSSSVS